MNEYFSSWKFDFNMDFDIKPVMTDEETIAEHKSVVSLMASAQKIGFSD
tara:strand:+ start:572 stop:718 length:147 start_codon:yes stop_codon:yes gene_type:complete